MSLKYSVLDNLLGHPRIDEEKGRYKEMIVMDAAVKEIEDLRARLSQFKDVSVIEAMIMMPSVHELVTEREKHIHQLMSLLKQIAVQTDPEWSRTLARDYMQLWSYRILE